MYYIFTQSGSSHVLGLASNQQLLIKISLLYWLGQLLNILGPSLCINTSGTPHLMKLLEDMYRQKGSPVDIPPVLPTTTSPRSQVNHMLYEIWLMTTFIPCIIIIFNSKALVL